MNKQADTASAWICHPVDGGRWADVERLFGEAGGRGGCWCMRWRLSREQYESGLGAGNRQRLRAGIKAGQIHGVLAYAGERPVAWCSFAPREQFPVLDQSEALARVDPRPVWSVSCFYVTPAARRQGVTGALLAAVIAHARTLEVATLEAYPLDPPQPKLPVAACWTGLLGTFLAAGFVEVARRAPARPVVRLDLALASAD